MRANLDTAVTDIVESAGRRVFILDLCKEPAPPPYVSREPRDPVGDQERIARELAIQTSYNNTLTSLLNPADGFASWRIFVHQFPGAIPVIQFSDAATEARSILRQAALLSRTNESIAIRICENTDSSIFEIVAQIMSILQSPDRLLLIFDCGQSRIRITQRSAFAANGITAILNQMELAERPRVQAVCLSNSFTSPTHEGLRDYSNFDWRVWAGARGVFPFKFGDYGAINRLRRSSTYVPSDSKPSVVLPLETSWLVYRHPNTNDLHGWIDGASAVLSGVGADPMPDAWGSEMIARAANGDIDGISSARFWHAIKVNIHLHRQINYTPEALEDYEDPS